MGNVVIFGNKDFASLAHFYLKHDSSHQVVGFTVHRAYLNGETTFEELPLVPFEDLEAHFPPGNHLGFAPMAPRKMNSLRQQVFQEFKGKGFALISYVSSHATVFPGTSIGDNCFILEDNTIQPYVSIGNNVVLWSGNHIGHHSVIKDHVFFTSHVVLSGHCTVEPSCFFGVNATIRDQLTIGEGTLVGMAAAINANTEPWSLHKGETARAAKVSSRDIDF